MPETDVPKRVLLVDDHPCFRHGLISLIADESTLYQCEEASTEPEALELVHSFIPDVVLLDITLPGTNGLKLLEQLLAQEPALQVLVVSMHEDASYALRALRLGAKGYAIKEDALDSILTGLRQIANGGTHISPKFNRRLIFKWILNRTEGALSPVDKLTPREAEVLGWIGLGCTSREIAAFLTLSLKTIETHRTHIKEKLAFTDPHDLVSFAVDWAIYYGTIDQRAELN